MSGLPLAASVCEGAVYDCMRVHESRIIMLQLQGSRFLGIKEVGEEVGLTLSDPSPTDDPVRTPVHLIAGLPEAATQQQGGGLHTYVDVELGAEQGA